MADEHIPTASPEAERLFDEHGLTERERLAARSALAGMTAETAAPLMGISPSTVGSLRQHAYRKLGVAGSAELVEKYGAPAAPTPADAAAREALLSRGLSETQASVLALVLAGRSSAEIARELGIAPGTVSSARANGYRLLGVHSRAELAELLKSGEKDASGARGCRGRGSSRRSGGRSGTAVRPGAFRAGSPFRAHRHLPYARHREPGRRGGKLPGGRRCGGAGHAQRKR